MFFSYSLISTGTNRFIFIINIIYSILIYDSAQKFQLGKLSIRYFSGFSGTSSWFSSCWRCWQLSCRFFRGRLCSCFLLQRSFHILFELSQHVSARIIQPDAHHFGLCDCDAKACVSRRLPDELRKMTALFLIVFVVVVEANLFVPQVRA